MITVEKFKERTGRDPDMDDMDRVNCGQVGILHLQCGWCEQHDLPRFQCLCENPTPWLHEPRYYALGPRGPRVTANIRTGFTHVGRLELDINSLGTSILGIFIYTETDDSIKLFSYLISHPEILQNAIQESRSPGRKRA